MRSAAFSPYCRSGVPGKVNKTCDDILRGRKQIAAVKIKTIWLGEQGQAYIAGS